MTKQQGTGRKHPIPALKDGDFLNGKPPSLWGIVPMQTTLEDAREVLRDKHVLKACKTYEYPATGSMGIACWPYFNLYQQGGIVKFVEFMPAVSITVSQALAAHGVPEGVLSAYTDFPDGNIYTILILFYDKIWTSLTLVEQVPRIYTVTRDTKVAHIAYAKPHLRVTSSPQRVPWKGYGDYPATDATAD
jgi:hypothetical protein